MPKSNARLFRWAQNHAQDVKDWAKNALMQSLLLRQEQIGEKPRECHCHKSICCMRGHVGLEVYESALESMPLEPVMTGLNSVTELDLITEVKSLIEVDGVQ